MSSSPHEDLAAKIARGGPGIRSQLQRMIARLLDRHRLASRVFVDPATGTVSAAAAEWMAELARDNFVHSTTWSGDRDTMLINEGRRRLALEILHSARLDTERLAALKRQEREVE